MGQYEYFKQISSEDNSLAHMKSTTNEKGSDNKNNNSSEYNHYYYMTHKKKKTGEEHSNVKYETYKEGDSDFDESNFSKENNLGDTDFYGFKNSDGSWVILEEDMKWTVPGSVTKEKLVSALEKFEKEISAKRESGEKHTADDWTKAATSALNKASKIEKPSEKKNDYLAHHGILGQKWGHRRYQNADGSLTEAGKSRYGLIGDSIRKTARTLRYGKAYDSKYAQNLKTNLGKTRYTNLDGTLNERGKKLASTFAGKEINHNNKYYDKMVKKYKKAAEAFKDDPELSKKYTDMADSAEKSRNTTNENLKNMSLDDILTIQNQRNQRIAQIASGAAGIAGAASLVGAALNGNTREKIHNQLSNFDPAMPYQKLEAWTLTPQGATAMKYVDESIRAYSDVHAYVIGTMADQAINRLNKMGVPEKVGSTVGKSLGKAGEAARKDAKIYKTANAATDLLIDSYKKIKKET